MWFTVLVSSFRTSFRIILVTSSRKKVITNLKLVAYLKQIIIDINIQIKMLFDTFYPLKVLLGSFGWSQGVETDF